MDKKAWRNYKINQKKSLAALKRNDMLSVCRYVKLMDKWYLAAYYSEDLAMQRNTIVSK